MRWGVRDEATDDHQTTSICLEEIANCQRASLGPNFVFFGGQKYGYRPVPAVIPERDFAKILKTMKVSTIKRASNRGEIITSLATRLEKV